MTGTAEHVFDFVPDQILDGGARRAKVFARIEFFGIAEYFANASGHGEPQVGVNVDFRATHAARDFDVGFGHALGIGHLAAVFVDLDYQILRTLDAP